jgi:hypothetical protein
MKQNNLTQYIGNELELFQYAVNWKSYYKSKIESYIKGSVLEVGAGFGSTTKVLCSKNCKIWTALEPDIDMYKKLQKLKSENTLPCNLEIYNTDLLNLNNDILYDTIIYIDVLEHIENDQDELNCAFSKLSNSGHLIILSPAHNFVFSKFDKRIGHFRRYNKKSLKSIIPEELKVKKLFYLDSIGLLSSLANKYFLKQESPTIKQIYFWDRILLKVSKFFDIFLSNFFGKSIILICQK